MVPYTIGTRRRDHDETSLTLVFHDPRQVERARLILAELDKFSEIELIKTRQIQLEVSFPGEGNFKLISLLSYSRNRMQNESLGTSSRTMFVEKES